MVVSITLNTNAIISNNGYYKHTIKNQQRIKKQCTLFSLTSSSSTLISSFSGSRNLNTISHPKNYIICSSSKDHIDSISMDLDKPHKGHENDNDNDNNKNMTALEKHAAFFDRNKDGLIYPWETFQGFNAIGLNMLVSAVAAIVVNVGLSAVTRPGEFPDPLFPIEVKNIKNVKHGSDTNVYDNQGRFIEKNFEEIFSEFALKHKNALTHDELMKMVGRSRDFLDFAGSMMAFAEWEGLYFLCKDKDGLLQKDTIKRCFEGTLFEHMEKERLAKKEE